MGRIVRLRVRDSFVDGKLMSKVVQDLQILLGLDMSEDCIQVDNLNLWDDKERLVKFGVNYSEFSRED